MRKIYHLSTCNTCQRIIKEVEPGKDFILQDIKTKKITEGQLEEMHKLSGSYESLFSRVARKYKALNLKEKQLSEEDYKTYILSEYTFLKRPVFIIDREIFIGNSKKNIEAVRQALS
ncbi:MAG: hypothetical protein KTR26_10845 [Flammeovirgaceae bacterium]|nr:hypothetical protein [Flammeovirgaceae bacterium]